MAIDTKSLTDIITEFRALQSKDAVSPESLGYILQRIVDLLAPYLYHSGVEGTDVFTTFFNAVFRRSIHQGCILNP